ncbi:MAG: TIGR00730 family Rossman fold protein [Thermaurantiacus sp.]
MRSLLVFCGSRTGANPRHAGLARSVGALLAERSVRLVYGGGALGLMGEIGRAAIGAGGRATGVIPRFLMDWEVAEPLCTDMRVVDSLHTRKAAMFAESDAVLALPGGLGTLDELIEILSWRNLRLHARPVWLLGDDGYWAPFRALLQHVVREGFAGDGVEAQVRELDGLDALAALLPAP